MVVNIPTDEHGGAGGFTSHADMLGVSGQITTGALTRRTAGGGAGCRNLHRGMRLASGGGLLDVFGLRGLPVMGWSQWQQCYDSLPAIIYISLPTPTSSGDGFNGCAAMT